MRSISVFGPEFKDFLLTHTLSLAHFDEADAAAQNDLHNSVQIVPDDPTLSPENGPNQTGSCCCSLCHCDFRTVSLQRQHFQSDWHRYNLQLSLIQRPPISYSVWKLEQQKPSSRVNYTFANDYGRAHNLSTRDTKSTIMRLYSTATAHGHTFLKASKIASNGEITDTFLELYTCLYMSDLDKKKLCSLPTTESVVLSLKTTILGVVASSAKTTVPQQQDVLWAVLMVSGGHFAGTIFNRDCILQHKTMHAYTVRRRQGGTQFSHDNRGAAGRQAKSAGASLRRFNERKFTQHVQHVISNTWRNYLEQCTLIAYRAAGPFNKAILFGNNVLSSLRIRQTALKRIPFCTMRPKLTELKRVHNLLTTVNVFESCEEAFQYYTKLKDLDSVEKKRLRQPRPQCATSNDRSSSSSQVEFSCETTSEEELCDMYTSMQTVDTSDLKEFDDTLTARQRRCKSNRVPPTNLTKVKRLIIEAIQEDNVNSVKDIFECSDSPGINDCLEERDRDTALHKAVVFGSSQTIRWLLEQGADPCTRNKRGQTAYRCATSPSVQQVLRDYANEHPHQHNYHRADIPIHQHAMTTNIDRKMVKRRRFRRRKRQHEDFRTDGVVEQAKKDEMDDRTRFLQLNDKEKIAVLTSNNANIIVKARCFQCGDVINSKLPFQYNENRFCSIECLQTHRIKNLAIKK